MVKNKSKYTDRFYRKWVDSDLAGFEVKVEETDLFALADKILVPETELAVRKYRADIENYIKYCPEFETTLEPITFDNEAPDIIKSMMQASEKAGVGPMAAVAGAIAEFVGNDLLELSKNVIIENGGDIFVKSSADRTFGIFAGDSPLTGKLAILIRGPDTPLGVCASSGTVGSSLSFGKADAVLVVARDAALSDAWATAICNRVTSKGMIKEALDLAKSVGEIKGCVIIYGDKVGSVGEIELV